MGKGLGYYWDEGASRFLYNCSGASPSPTSSGSSTGPALSPASSGSAAEPSPRRPRGRPRKKARVQNSSLCSWQLGGPMSSNPLCAVNGSANFCQVLAEPALSVANLGSSAEPAQVPVKAHRPRKAKATEAPEPSGGKPRKKAPVQNSSFDRSMEHPCLLVYFVMSIGMPISVRSGSTWRNQRRSCLLLAICGMAMLRNAG